MDEAQRLNELAGKLVHICPDMRRAYAQCGPLNSRKRPEGFETLLHTIVGQVISRQAAETIWARMVAQGLTTQAALAVTEDPVLQTCGLSRPKIKTIRAVISAQINYDGLFAHTDDEIEQQLTKIWGIGTWSAQIYMLFAMGRADVFAPKDLALQAAAAHLLGLQSRPTDTALAQIAERWRPYRSIAAQILWAYYAHINNEEKI